MSNFTKNSKFQDMVFLLIDGSIFSDTANECFFTHLIDENGVLDEVGFDDFLKKVNLAACGLNYAVVSIMGPQSSGMINYFPSVIYCDLLNMLYFSDFDGHFNDSNRKEHSTKSSVWDHL